MLTPQLMTPHGRYHQLLIDIAFSLTLPAEIVYLLPRSIMLKHLPEIA
jgi:hypothetical protein